MSECLYVEVCPFFIAQIGYSPALHESMKQRYCLGDSTECARLLALEIVEARDIPDDLLPTDTGRLSGLYVEVYGHKPR